MIDNINPSTSALVDTSYASANIGTVTSLNQDPTVEATSNLSYILDDYYYLGLMSNNYYELDTYLLWYVTGDYNITYTTQNMPSWASLDQTNELFKLNAPELASDTNFSFSVFSTVNRLEFNSTSGQYETVSSSEFNQTIIFEVKGWSVDHCARWSNSSSYVCEECNQGYQL